MIPWRPSRSKVLPNLLAAAWVLATCGAPARAQRPAPLSPGATLKVATRVVPPFVMKDGDKLSGFSIDLWNAIAGHAGVAGRRLDSHPRSGAHRMAVGASPPGRDHPHQSLFPRHLSRHVVGGGHAGDAGGPDAEECAGPRAGRALDVYGRGFRR